MGLNPSNVRPSLELKTCRIPGESLVFSPQKIANEVGFQSQTNKKSNWVDILNQQRVGPIQQAPMLFPRSLYIWTTMERCCPFQYGIFLLNPIFPLRTLNYPSRGTCLSWLQIESSWQPGLTITSVFMCKWLWVYTTELERDERKRKEVLKMGSGERNRTHGTQEWKGVKG